MAKHLTKISKFGGQYRLTIPKALIDELKWRDVEFVIVEELCYGMIKIRRFLDGESLKSGAKATKNGVD